MSTTRYYHFTKGKLRNGDAVPPIGEWLEVKGSIEPCVRGLHASEHPFDALSFAPGNHLHLVELGGLIIPHGDPVDKVVAERRKIVASIDAEQLCRDFSRRVARDVLHLWNAPEVVKQYLETGDEKLRAAAWAAARAAAGAAAWAAARAAWDAGDAAGAAWDAGDAAWAAAGAEKYNLYRQWFKEAVDAAFAGEQL